MIPLPPLLPTLTLHQAADRLGVSYSFLSRRWRSLDWRPANSTARPIPFYEYAVEEWYLSRAQHSQGPPTLRWLPWDTPALGRVLLTNFQPHSPPPFDIPFFTCRHRDADQWHRRYHPPSIKEWTDLHGHPYHFLKGFEGLSRIQWDEYINSPPSLVGVWPHLESGALEAHDDGPLTPPEVG